MNVSNEEFIKVWQASKSVREIAKKVKDDRMACSGRANYLRRIGIPLKKFGRIPNSIEHKKLKALALKYAPDGKK